MKTLHTALAFVFVLVLLGAPAALASGPSSPSQGRDPFAGDDALVVTDTIRCVVKEVHADGTIVVIDAGKERPHVLPYNDTTEVRAQDKRAFGGRRKLAIDDLEVGHEIKVTVLPATGEVLRIQILKDKAPAEG